MFFTSFIHENYLWVVLYINIALALKRLGKFLYFFNTRNNLDNILTI